MPNKPPPAKKLAPETGEPAEAGVRKTYTINLAPTRTVELPDDPGTMSYDQLDQIVREGSLVFAATGVALAEIKKRELWKESHPSWAAYCESRIGSSATHANRLIKSAEVMADLTPVGVIVLPTCESQARPLAKLKTAEDRRAVWTELVGEAGEPPPAELVKSAVDRFLADPDPEDNPKDDCEEESEDDSKDEGEEDPKDNGEEEPEGDCEEEPEGDPEDEGEEDPEGDPEDKPKDEGEGDGEGEPEDDGEAMAAPEWVDGVISRENLEQGLKELDEHPKNSDPVVAQPLLSHLSAVVNSETAGVKASLAKACAVRVAFVLWGMAQ